MVEDNDDRAPSLGLVHLPGGLQMCGCGCRDGAQNTGDTQVQKPSGWQPDCPINVVTELGAGAAVSESGGEPQCGSWRGSLEADWGLQRIECLREGKGGKGK